MLNFADFLSVGAKLSPISPPGVGWRFNEFYERAPVRRIGEQMTRNYREQKMLNGARSAATPENKRVKKMQTRSPVSQGAKALDDHAHGPVFIFGASGFRGRDRLEQIAPHSLLQKFGVKTELRAREKHSGHAAVTGDDNRIFFGACDQIAEIAGGVMGGDFMHGTTSLNTLHGV